MLDEVQGAVEDELYRFERRRRRIYVVALTLVTGVVLFGWVVRGADDVYRVWSTPISLLVLAGLVALIYSERVPLARLEPVMLLILAAMPLSRQIWLFHFAGPVDEQWLRLLGNSYWATSALIVIVCTISAGRRGLLAGAGIVAACVAVALSGIAGGLLRGAPGPQTLAYIAGALLFLTLFLVAMSGATVMRDQWQRALARAELYSDWAMNDQLTGLANRRAADEVLSTVLAESDRHARPFAVILGDLDRFKQLNDTAGHGAGDAVLAAVAAALRATVRASDTVVRWGGEEFLVVLPDTDLVGAARLAERCRAAVEGTTRDGHRITITLGVAEYESGETRESLIARADRLLYAGKARRGNRVEAGDRLEQEVAT